MTKVLLSSHNKTCQAHAIICAVENMRDAEDYTAADLTAAISDGTIAEWAESYFDGLLECQCGSD
jgi:hypothetical protein